MSLLELIVYLFLLSLLVSMVGYLSTHYVHTVRIFSNRCYLRSAVNNTIDLLRQDIAMASANLSDWKNRDAHELTFVVGRSQIQWLIVDSKLIRSQRDYNLQTNSLLPPVASLILESIELFDVEIHEIDSDLSRVKSIRVVLKVSCGKEKAVYQGSLILHNGILK